MVDPTGYTALDLIGFTDKGDYNPLSTYLKNDLANFNGTKWRCKADDTTGVTPSEGLTWTAFMVLPTDHTMDMIAPVETSPSANAYVTGKQLIFNEVLYDVMDDIAIGDTLEVGVNIDTSDTIVEKIEEANGAIQQLTENIAPVEGATSLHAYAVGKQLIYNDTLYKVIAPIAVNDALVVDTNIEVSNKTVIEQVEDLDANKMSYAVNTELGAHNILECTASTGTAANVTFSVDSEGIVTTSGTSTQAAPSNRSIFAYNSRLVLDASKTYRLSGCPAGGGSTTYDVLINFNDSQGQYISNVEDEGNGVIFTPPSNASYAVVYIRCYRGVDVTGKVFKPMITVAEDIDPNFAPYAMTNRELTEVKTITGVSATSTAYSLEYASVKRVGNIVQVFFSVKISSNISAGGNADGTLSGLPLPFMNCQGDTYTGTKTVGWLIQPDGTLRIRAVDALVANEYVAVAATYICK